ncbi:pyrroloquinoline quinone-dependent dehydrogenase [Limimaricola sp. G21655-S1]|uniref:pyrroloquinoline quinone-dependent dehydrogenase n=1 Tax=Limimaricola sp. G21655-S1 TaxID=3014768 RepID=UPI0022AFE4B4|nr:pyrroloquinoline quinone-dependent dehydrogenase [Limimaricola sp. G21655-S1]MCZ4261135.1 pyrroloquinoline quinone-dependent dehydrogenase [Limimaricola sp. G21655-S1]
MTYRDKQPGIGLTLIAAIVASVALAIAYFRPESGVAGSVGAGLALFGALAVAVASALVLFKWMPYWLNLTLKWLTLLGAALTAVAAYFLMQDIAMWSMVLATIGAIWNLVSRKGHDRRTAMLVLLALPLAHAPEARAQDWPGFHGDLQARKYSPLTEITAANVHLLEPVWEVETGDVSDGSGDLPQTVWSATPVYANETLYVGTPFYRILALDPATGEELWSYDSQARLEALTQPALKNRGVTYWEEPGASGTCAKRVYIGTMDAKLHAVDADTGQPCEDFAEGGVLDVNQWNDTNDRWPLSLLQPPVAHEGRLFIGWAGKDWESAQAPPGTVFAVDAKTGELDWTVNFIPKELWDRTGTANVWTHMTVDPERDIIYMPVSSPSPNYYGGNRTEELPLATSVTAVDTNSGEIIWSRQLVHHDIWDYDTGAAPTLVDIERDGETIPALIQTSKQGMLYVLNRETGEPVFGMEERPVPASDLPGEEAAPTQPFYDVPKPTNTYDTWPGIWWLADLASFGYCSRTLEELRYEGLFTPPTAEGKGTLMYPGTAGGMQWGGGALDPETNTFYVNTQKVAQILRMIPREEYEEIAGESGAEQGFYPQEGVPYGFELTNFLTPLGLPCWKPPFGTILAYDLDTGEQLWERPFGQTQQWGFYAPEGWGSPTLGGPAVTAGGVIFIGASMDAHVRALSAASGEELWKWRVEAPAVAIPAVYEHEGRQYVSFVAGGNPILKPQVGDQLITFALPMLED